MSWEKIQNAFMKFQIVAFTICGSVIVILQSANGIGRYFLKMGITWGDEIVRIMFVWGCFIGITSAFITDGHIGFDSLAKMNSKTRLVSKVVNGICLILIGIVIIIYGTQFVKQMGRFPLPASHVPIGVLYSAGVVAGVCWLLIGVVKIYFALKPEKEEKEKSK